MVDCLEIEKALFIQRQKEEYYKYVIGSDFNRCEKAYEITLPSQEKVGAMLLKQNVPKATQWKNKIVISANNELHVFSIDGTLIKSFSTSIDIQEYVLLENKIIVIGEIDILLIDETCEIIQKISLPGILTQYDFIQDVMVCQTDEEEIVKIELNN